jgi:hypothetical protein
VDSLITFPFQTEDVVCISGLMVWSPPLNFQAENKQAVTFIPLVANILQSPGELYRLSMNSVCPLGNCDLNIFKTVVVFAFLFSPI